MKRERLISAEIDEQNDMVALSLLECVESWEKGLREFNELYGCDLHVELNPVLIQEIADQFTTAGEEPVTEQPEEPEEETSTTVEEESQEEEVVEEPSGEPVEEPEEETNVSEQIEQLEEVVEEVIETIIDEEGGEDVESEES